MLDLNKKLFYSLCSLNVDFFVYKGLEHFNEDASGDRGDIDIFVSSESMSVFNEVIKELKFSCVKVTHISTFYYGIDLKENKPSLIEVVNMIPVGKKANKNYFLPLEYKDFELADHEKYKHVKVLSQKDQLKLNLLINSSNGNELKSDKIGFEFGDLSSYRTLDRLLLSLFSDYKSKCFCELFEKNKSLYLIKNKNNLLKSFLKKVYYKFKILLGFPFFRIRKFGRLIAFVGVDGAGKTTVTSKIESMKYFKTTGLKCMYFGNNEYWIPGLNYLAGKVNNKFLKLILSMVARFDRQSRVFIALFYMLQGRDVLADRYYYDDIFTLTFNKKECNGTLKSKVRVFLISLFSVRMLYTPTKTLFLNVSPDVAYSRKQDYCFKKLESNIDGYRELMAKRDEVIYIDADQDFDLVFKKVISEIVS
ncbi:dTMP kinase [Pseudoalteromonas undina]|uniref:dTMP kinase n=1 Tax=Pseudoalteromonas undina TaxID=43660 RepID=UPI00186873E6|nr:hypothetical protein [Pseudoalteromonas undina]